MFVVVPQRLPDRREAGDGAPGAPWGGPPPAGWNSKLGVLADATHWLGFIDDIIEEYD